jgi:hypothetical protein
VHKEELENLAEAEGDHGEIKIAGPPGNQAKRRGSERRRRHGHRQGGDEGKAVTDLADSRDVSADSEQSPARLDGANCRATPITRLRPTARRIFTSARLNVYS